MNTYIRKHRIFLGGLAIVAWLGLGSGMAHAGVIPSVSATSPYAAITVATSAPYSVSIYKVNAAGAYDDVTDTWLPEASSVNADGTVVGKDVYLVINRYNGQTNVPLTLGAADSVSLFDTPPATFQPVTATVNTANPFLTSSLLTTSHYRGTCTNMGSNADTTPDFTFNPAPTTIPVGGSSVQGYKLTSRDCGGMAVLNVSIGGANPVKFIVPQDSLPGVAADGIAQIYQAQYPVQTCRIGSTTTTPPITPVVGTTVQDLDCTPTPTATTSQGDGFSNFDEYRGFIVSGVQKRTDWRMRDLFFHIVNAQCPPIGYTGAGLLNLYLQTSSGDTLFSKLNTLSDTRVHPLGYTANAINNATGEWVDRFVSYRITDTTKKPPTGSFTYITATGTTQTTAPVDDRQVNLNALYPVRDTITLKYYQKGIRVTECLDANDTSSPPVMGGAGWGSANGPDNAILYTQRIVNYVIGLIGTKSATYKTFNASGQMSTTTIESNQNDIIANHFMFYLAMEVGHSVRLNTTSANGYHHAAGTGDNLDQAIVSTTSGSTINFVFPTVYLSTDQQNFRLHN